MMKEYKRIELKITEFKAEDVIATSGDPQSGKKITMYSPNYRNDTPPTHYDFNWTLWQ